MANEISKKDVTMKTLNSLLGIEGIYPESLLVDTYDEVTQERGNFLPLGVKLALFRIKYPTGRVDSNIYFKGFKDARADWFAFAEAHVYPDNESGHEPIASAKAFARGINVIKTMGEKTNNMTDYEFQYFVMQFAAQSAKSKALSEAGIDAVTSMLEPQEIDKLRAAAPEVPEEKPAPVEEAKADVSPSDDGVKHRNRLSYVDKVHKLIDEQKTVVDQLPELATLSDTSPRLQEARKAFEDAGVEITRLVSKDAVKKALRSGETFDFVEGSFDELLAKTKSGTSEQVSDAAEDETPEHDSSEGKSFQDVLSEAQAVEPEDLAPSPSDEPEADDEDVEGIDLPFPDETENPGKTDDDEDAAGIISEDLDKMLDDILSGDDEGAA